MKLHFGPPRLAARSRSKVPPRSQRSRMSSSRAGWSGFGGSLVKMSGTAGFYRRVSRILGWRRAAPDATVRQTSTLGTRTPLSKKEIQELKAQLLAERKDLEAQYKELEESSFGTNQSELTGEMGFDEEYADAGTATFE